MASPQTHKLVRAVVDYGGLAAFLAGFLIMRDIQKATLWLVIGSAAALALGLIVEKRIAPMPLISGGAALIFGGLTLVFHDDRFIKMKPTVMNLLFAVGLIIGVAARKNPLKLLLGDSVRLSEDAWRKLAVRYAGFFLFTAALNELVWRTQPDAIWVPFRFPGLLILAVVFSLTQVPFMMKHAHSDAPPPAPVE